MNTIEQIALKSDAALAESPLFAVSQIPTVVSKHNYPGTIAGQGESGGGEAGGDDGGEGGGTA